ncbi:MAG: hypothetical protein ACI8QZ_001805 [Chlamydiales bacterium]
MKWGACCWALAALGCSRPAVVPRTLRLERIQPESTDGVYLNEDLIFTFSRPVDLSTVTSEALKVVDADGREAHGRWRVTGRMVRFQPSPVLAGDLSGGGYRPGTTYQVRITGFPQLDGIRAVGGAPLGSSFTWGFRTVAVSDQRGGFVFDDATPGTGDMLRLMSFEGQGHAFDEPGVLSFPGRSSESSSAGRVRVGMRDSLFLVCREPLDPSTLFDEDFTLHGNGRAVSVHTRFRANHDVGESPLGDVCAVIEVIPHSTLERGLYQLRLDPDLRLQDFGGNPVWRPWGVSLGQQIEVVEETSVEGRGGLFFSFLDDDRFSPIEVPGSDGSAYWRADGQVRVRYPAAAGSGADGSVVLAAEEARADVHATRLSLDRTCRLSPGRGLRVIRAQGKIEIRGDLIREGSYGSAAGPTGLAEDLSELSQELSAWLERVAAQDEDWTVVIAGGDLVVTGAIRVDTPLLLVSGGRLRIQGEVQARAQELWLLGGGGGLRLKGQASVASLVLDSPTINTLKVPLHYAAVSSPVPNVGRAARWLSAQAGGQARAGSWRVRYLPAQNPLLFESAVDDPRLLDGMGPIRVLIELGVQPGPIWDPPFVDFVRLTWDEEALGEGN